MNRLSEMPIEFATVSMSMVSLVSTTCRSEVKRERMRPLGVFSNHESGAWTIRLIISK